MNVPSTLHPGWFAAAAVCLLVGLWLLRRGWRGRRVGDERFCGKCKYSLKGLTTAERCPECGSVLSGEGGILIGIRTRRPVTFLLGGVLAIGAAAALAPAGRTWVQRHDWYSWKPTDYVLDDLASLTSANHIRAAREIERRLTKRRLSPAQHSRAIDLILAVQQSSVTSAGGGLRMQDAGILVPWLCEEAKAGRLDPKRCGRLIAQSQAFELRIDPSVEEFSRARFTLVRQDDLLGAAGWVDCVAEARVSVDGGPSVPLDPRARERLRAGDWGGVTSTVLLVGQGRHVVTVTVHMEFLKVPKDETVEGWKLVHAFDLSQTATVTVRPATPSTSARTPEEREREAAGRQR